MDRDPLDMDMGDDDQEDEIRAYRRNVEDPPADLRARYYENEDDGRLGIGDELEQEWTSEQHAAELAEEDERSAETAAMEIIQDTDL
jgi:hypothetical protein